MRRLKAAAFATAGTTMLLLSPAAARANSATPVATYGGTVTIGSSQYTVGTPSLAEVENGPWQLAQGDQTYGATGTGSAGPYPPYAQSLPTYTSPTSGSPNLATLSEVGSGNQSGVSGTPGVLAGYCSSDGPNPESGAPNPEPTGYNVTTNSPASENNFLPMAPYYFPFVEKNPTGPGLIGYFDYRPKDTDEGVSVATSTDGVHWNTVDKAVLEQNAGWCANGDTNDNGQGHAFVGTVNGTTYLYTLSRPTGDYLGVNMIAHALDSSSANPADKLDPSEPVGVDPDEPASGSSTVSTSGGSTVTLTSTFGLGQGPAQIVAPVTYPSTSTAGVFEDISAASPDTTLFSCTSTGTNSLTGCTSLEAGSIQVGDGDEIAQVISTVGATTTIPQATTTASTTSLSLAAFATASINYQVYNNASPGGRFYIDGYPVYCVEPGSTPANGAASTWSQCSTTKPGGLAVSTGDAVTTDPVYPVAPSTYTQPQIVNGLVSPDGIVGTIPAADYSGPGSATVPSGDTVFLYGEKIDSYYAPTTTNTSGSYTASTTPSSIAINGDPWVGNNAYPSSDTPTTTNPVTFVFGDNSTAGDYLYESCTGVSSTALTGCSYTTPSSLPAGVVEGSAGDKIATGSLVGLPGAAVVPYSTTESNPGLQQTGEGSTSAKNLYKNNEDYTVLRYAYTADGINFTDLGITGAGTINSPDSTASPQTGPSNLSSGSSDSTVLRWTGTRGTLIVNPSTTPATLEMFLSGAWATDGDSDAFNQVFYTQSTDGGSTWSVPTVLISTDYTFSARANQDASTGSALGISGYYSGRAYGPTVVPTSDLAGQSGSNSLTMLFAGYSTPKPLPKNSAAIGTASTTWSPSTSDAALYRQILDVTLSPSAPAQTPEAPVALALPVAALGVLGAGLVLYRRRRPPATA